MCVICRSRLSTQMLPSWCIKTRQIPICFFFINAFSIKCKICNDYQCSQLYHFFFFSKMIFPQFWPKNRRKLEMIFTYHKDHMKVCEDNILIVIVPKVLYLLTILMARFLKVAKFLGASNLIWVVLFLVLLAILFHLVISHLKREIPEKREVCSDMGSLIGKTQCRFSNFLATLNLREINFAWIRKVKNCRFKNFGGFEFWFLTFSIEKFFQKLNFKACEVFHLLKLAKIDFT